MSWESDTGPTANKSEKMSGKEYINFPPVLTSVQFKARENESTKRLLLRLHDASPTVISGGGAGGDSAVVVFVLAGVGR